MKDSTQKEINILIERYPCMEPLRARFVESVELLSDSYRQGGKMLVCGNGGSAADSLHIVGELMKSFVLARKLPEDFQDKLRDSYPEVADYYIKNLQGAAPAISLVSEAGLITAYGNDNAPDLAFAQQVLGYGRLGDALIAISTSGNSGNVLHAARIARTIGVKVIALTGQGGGKLAELSDVLLDVPSKVTYQIQELHLPVYHMLCLAVEQELFGTEEK